MKNEDAIKIIAQAMIFCGRKNGKHLLVQALNQAINALSGNWIPVITKKMNRSEMRFMDEIGRDVDFDYGVAEWNDSERLIYKCELPSDEDEVLITTKEGWIDLVKFYRAENRCCEFDGYEDREDVIAWMPAPQAYKRKEENT